MREYVILLKCGLQTAQNPRKTRKSDVMSSIASKMLLPKFFKVGISGTNYSRMDKVKFVEDCLKQTK